jgi:Thioredoxin-like
MRRRLLLASAAAAIFAASGASWAVVPPAYEPMVLQPQPAAAGAMEFDLSPAVERARREGRRIYLYLGAHDCPYCKRYEAFLDAHAAELKPHFAPYLFVELRGALTVTAQHLRFKLAGRSQPYARVCGCSMRSPNR